MTARAQLSATLVVLLLGVADVADGSPYDKGDHILISGRVSDAEGAAVGGVTVLLELSYTRFSLRRFKRISTNTLRVPVLTTVDGQYLHDWRWDGFYNTFALAVALPVQRDGRDDFEILVRADVTDQVKKGAPVTMPLVVEDVGYLEWLRRFLDARASDDEKRIYQELGRPDRLDFESADGSGESAWWYFEIGKVYRFKDRALEQVEPFDPVKSLD